MGLEFRQFGLGEKSLGAIFDLGVVVDHVGGTAFRLQLRPNGIGRQLGISTFDLLVEIEQQGIEGLGTAEHLLHVRLHQFRIVEFRLSVFDLLFDLALTGQFILEGFNLFT